MTHEIPQPTGAKIPNLQHSLGRRRRSPQPVTPRDERVDPATQPAEADPQSPPQQPAAPSPVQAETAPQRPVRPQPSTRSQTDRRGRAAAEPERSRRQVTFTLPIELAERLGDYARTKRLTRAAVIFLAITQTREDLPEHFAATPPAGEGQLFSEAPTPHSSSSTPRVTTHAQMASGDLATLDRMRQESGAPDRSAYIEMALSTWFDRTTQQ